MPHQNAIISDKSSGAIQFESQIARMSDFGFYFVVFIAFSINSGALQSVRTEQ